MTPRTKAVFLDALGTLVELEPPWVGLREALGDGIPQERLVRAVLSRELGREVEPATLLEAIRFAPFADAPPALDALRADGVRLVCVSNWDCSLGRVLESSGLLDRLDGVVSSAEAGARKPDPAIFAAALALVECGPDEALHVGDTPEEDLEGARRAGIRALLIDREGGGDIASLEEIPGKL
jgi:HAD superfamily hydrolase (TIGR01549 family)